MNLCSDNHEEICFDGIDCPCCDEMSTMDDEISDLSDTVEKMKEMIKELEKRISDLLVVNTEERMTGECNVI